MIDFGLPDMTGLQLAEKLRALPGLAGTTSPFAVTKETDVTFAGPDVSDVIVGGQPVVRGGRHLTIDVAAELGSAITAAWAD